MFRIMKMFQWTVTPLRDNHPHDHYYYVIKVFTGMRHGSGTRSNVFFVLTGEKRDSGLREMSDGVTKVRLCLVLLEVLDVLLSFPGAMCVDCAK